MKKIIKIIIIIITVLFAFFIIGLLLENKTTTDNVKEIMEYYNCTYYKTTSSSEQGYGKDIYASFSYPTVDEYGASNQLYYEQVIGTLSSIMNKTNFRIIDEKQNINIRVIYTNGKTAYSINGNNNYYETEKAKLASKTNNNEKKTKLNVTSNLLNTIMKNNWSRAGVKQMLGSIDGAKDNYDYYIDEGYNVRTVNLKIFNIVFTNSYQQEVFSGIKTGMTNEEIIQILGEPLFIPEDNKFVIGYKSDELYAFFFNGNISIYRVEKLDEEKNEEFAKLNNELNENTNYKEYLNKLTDIYPDFDERIDTQDKIEILYRLKGFKVTFGNNNKNGIVLYDNYSGKITTDISTTDVINGDKLPKNIYVENSNPIFEYEYNRYINDYLNNSKNER